MRKKSWLDRVPPRIGHYLAGFADGEGSFNVSLRRKDDHTLGWQIVATFNVSQRDKTVLTLYKRHLGCGRLQPRKDGVWYYVVQNPTALHVRVIPFFRQFSFLSETKKRNFSIFRTIVSMMTANEHTSPEGLRRIMEIREKLNEGRGRKRKYELVHYQQYLAENPQRLNARALPREKRPWKA